jgi:hypothetical protein
VGEVFAGFVCGFFLSVLSAPLLAYLLLQMRGSSPVMARMLPEGTNTVALAMTVQFALFFFWTGLGIILGLILLAMDGATGSALGMRNPAFTLVVFSAAFGLSAPFALLVSAWWKQIVFVGVASFVLFGFLMPYMADWSKFDSPPQETNRPAPPIFNANLEGS